MAEDPATAKPLIRVQHPVDGHDGVALVTLDRPEALNALSFMLLRQLVTALQVLDADETCRAVVITGSGTKAFAAGADIKELAPQTPDTLRETHAFDTWDDLKRIRKPLIAAVRGHALGGGFELAMLCDMLIAGDDAQFGQPEIRIGVMPGAGGSQRLTRALGKAKAMELILTGRTMTAREADDHGLVTKVVPSEATLEEALALADRIAAMPPLAVLAAIDAIDSAYELPLDAGLARERDAFFDLFSTEDQREGMAAFSEKRSPIWRGR